MQNRACQPRPAATAAPSEALAPPSVLFPELYARVEQQHLYVDDKTFADAAPRRSPAAIMADAQARAQALMPK